MAKTAKEMFDHIRQLRTSGEHWDSFDTQREINALEDWAKSYASITNQQRDERIKELEHKLQESDDGYDQVSLIRDNVVAERNQYREAWESLQSQLNSERERAKGLVDVVQSVINEWHIGDTAHKTIQTALNNYSSSSISGKQSQ